MRVGKRKSKSSAEDFYRFAGLYRAGVLVEVQPVSGGVSAPFSQTLQPNEVVETVMATHREQLLPSL